ncbi:immunoglobulin lambda-1 light chain isoform X1 [Pangasianodon hypophthalmus]|uniref:immunoglobulin lambda-1 light chain isoform X1 n=2 Tax=Pangasianodon hypophthalmus TaxID=310915 RepID=UPI000F003BE0|nr:immunoglobulin lambda-1 light chain isoform X1 [Pangasianodon hypophthalmus]
MFEIRETERFSMAARLLLLCCVCTLRTSLSSVVFQSPEFINASIGDSFTLKCTRDLPTAYCYSSISWYKVNPRTGKLGEVRKGEDKLEDDKQTCTRTIVNAQVQDSGIYYCTSLHDKMVFIGTGTRVVISDTRPLKPSIVLYTPMEVDTPSVLLQCVVMDVVPSQIRVLWLIDGDERTGWTESGWTGHDDSASEFTRAQITIPADEWKEAAHIIECVVMYENQTMSQTLQRQSHSDSTCTWLLYGGCSVAVFTIAVALAVVMCLRKEKRATFPVKRHCADVDTQRKKQTQGKQDTLRTHLEKPSTASEVEYSCLNPEFLKLQTNTPTLELH